MANSIMFGFVCLIIFIVGIFAHDNDIRISCEKGKQIPIFTTSEKYICKKVNKK